MKRYLLLASTLLMACAASEETPVVEDQAKPVVVGLSGDLGAHDPTLIKVGANYCAFSTGLDNAQNPGGVIVHRSSGGIGGPWATVGTLPVPGWAVRDYHVHNIWAPSVVRNPADGKYYMYYAASEFGTNHSAIGVATSTDPCAPGSFTDLGPIKTSSGTDYNAIDPAVFNDGSNGFWMLWGSFFSGIKLQRMSNMTSFSGPITTLARRPGVANNPVEGAAITKRGAFYSLFASWDGCCNGVNSTYKTIVGRATSITGPYLDKNGVPLDQGGGTILLNNRANKIGQGGEDVYVEGNDTYLITHYYDANAGGSPKMDIKLLEWNGSFPLVREPLNGYDIADGGVYRLVNQTSGLCLDIENGSASPSAQIRQWECNGADAQNFRLERMSDGFYRLRSQLGDKSLCLDVENGSSTPGADIRLWACNNLSAQNWHLEDMGNGFHRVVGEGTHLALDNVNGSTARGGEIRTWSMNGFSPQNFRFEKRN